MVNRIGIDIGGTKIKGGIVTDDGQINYVIEERTNTKNILQQLLNLIDLLIKKSAGPIHVIGIATAGRVRFPEGIITYATSNLPGWTGTELKRIVEEKFQIPTIVDNDANCAAYAESKLGAAKGYKNVVCITLGTGVGAGIIINNQLIRGINGGTGEIGHMIFVPNGKPCNCGNKGCWEQYVSGTALKNEINMIKNDNSLRDITPEQLFKLAFEAHPTAKKIVDEFITNLAIGIASLQSILEIDCYVIGGGIIHSSEYWWRSFVNEINMLIKNPPEIKKAFFKNDAGLIGAAQLALDVLIAKTSSD